MAKVTVNVREFNKNLNEIHDNNDDFKKKIMSNIEKKDNQPDNGVAHMLLTAFVGGWSRMPDVGEKVACEKAGILLHLGYQAISVKNTDGCVCGYILVNDNDILHGTILDNDRFNVLPDKFIGTVVEVGKSCRNPNQYLLMIAVMCEAPEAENAFTVVSSGQNLLAPYGSVFTAKKEPKLNGSSAVFDVYDGTRKIGIIAPLTRMAIPGTEILSLLEANNYPDVFQVKVVGDGCYDGTNRAIKVKLILPEEVKKFTPAEVAAADKKILKKYLAYLLREGECSTRELMLLSENGRKKKEMLDKRYREIMQYSVQKLQAYFELL